MFSYKAKEKSTHTSYHHRCWQAYLNRKGEVDRQIVHLFMSVCDIHYFIPHLLLALTTWGDSVSFDNIYLSLVNKT